MAETYQVDRSTTLGGFLVADIKTQPWRIPYLIKCGAVRVYRARELIQLAGPDTRLRNGDYVQVEDPLPAACAKTLAAIPAADFRDYAFVPGTTDFEKAMAGLMDHRPQTIRIRESSIDSLAGFIRAMGSDTAFTNPIRHLVVVSHANPEGSLAITLSASAAATITYEDLEAAVKDKSLLIDKRLLEPRPKDNAGTSIAAAFLVRGCRIGLALPFLKKLKEALGNAITVIAPKHFHLSAMQSKPAGFVEYMSYNFPINRPKPFRNKAEVVRAFSGAGFLRVDGKPVPAKLWPLWIPGKNLNKQGDKPMPGSIVSPITKATEKRPGAFRYRLRAFLKQNGSVYLSKDPGNEVGRKRAVRDGLVKSLERYRDTHPFPEYIRYGYKTMDEFMDGWKWKFRYDKSTNLLYYNASRHEYVVIRPIVDPVSNSLILNYYPSEKEGKVIEQLIASDARFFASV